MPCKLICWINCFVLSPSKPPQSTKTSSGLNETSRNYLAEVNWHTGTNGSNAWHFNSNGLVSNFYDYEHSNNNGKICSTSDTCNDTVSRTTSWSGKVGLMYVSDYGYAVNNSTCLKTAIYNWWDNNNCLNSNWLSSNNEWSLTISASNDYAYRVFYLGKSIDTTAASLAYSIRPTIYLTANTIISGGTGTVADPYTLGL